MTVRMLILTAMLSIFQSPPKDAPKPEWAVRFVMPETEKEPAIYFSMLVRASSEGEAVMKGYRALSNHVAAISMDKLQFYDAGEKAK